MSTKNEALKQDVLAKSRRIIMGENLDDAVKFVNDIIQILYEHPELKDDIDEQGRTAVRLIQK